MLADLAGIALADLVAPLFFLASWAGYALYADREHRRPSLMQRMHEYRREWMRCMLERDNRMVDTQIIANLMSSASFCASPLRAEEISLATQRIRRPSLERRRSLVATICGKANQEITTHAGRSVRHWRDTARGRSDVETERVAGPRGGVPGPGGLGGGRRRPGADQAGHPGRPRPPGDLFRLARGRARRRQPRQEGAHAREGRAGQAESGELGPCVLVAGKYGFRLPLRLERMQAVLDEAAATRNGTTTVRARRLALDCLNVYVGLAGEPPKVRNAKQHEGSCGLYYDLVRTAFEAESLSNWAERAREAASDEKRQRTEREQEKAACELWAALEAREPLAD